MAPPKKFESLFREWSSWPEQTAEHVNGDPEILDSKTFGAVYLFINNDVEALNFNVISNIVISELRCAPLTQPWDFSFPHLT